MSRPYNERQILLTLSYIAYTGFYSIGPADAYYVHHWLQKWLRVLDPVRDQWTVVWGPEVFRFWATMWSDNVVYVVQHREDPNRYVMVIRGTNPVSLPNWILEDFLVLRQARWPYGAVPANLDPRLSEGTWLGLRVLHSLRARRGLPGQGTTLKQFLAGAVAARPDPEICVTGHSLGGALAPTLALWLHDSRGTAPASEEWDPHRRAAIKVVSFAGPTPGNEDFARWFDSQLGSRCDRVANDLDIATRAWSREALEKLDAIYSPQACMPLMARLAWKGVKHVIGSRGYSHVRSDQAPLRGIINTNLGPLFLNQAIHQHVMAYPELLGLKTVLPVKELLPVVLRFLHDGWRRFVCPRLPGLPPP